MKSTFITLTVGIFLLTMAFSGISCSREKSAEKTAPAPEQAKILGELKKGFAESKKTVVAKVNSADISMFELISEMNTVAPKYIRPGEKKDPGTDEQVRKEALDRLIYRELAVQEAIRQGMKVPQEKVDQQINKIRTDLKSEEAFQQKLSAMGMTEAELKKQVERAFLVEMITQKEVFDKVKIDIGLIRKTYEKDMALYKGPSGQMSFAEARPAIEEKLMTPRIQKREDEWVEGLKKKAKVEITLDEAAKGIQNVR